MPDDGSGGPQSCKDPHHGVAALPEPLRCFRELALEAVVELIGRSMEPTLWDGCRVRIRGGSAVPGAGEVVAFWDGDRVVVHRLEAIGADGTTFRARGDANGAADPWQHVDTLVGSVVAVPDRPTASDRWRILLRRLRRRRGRGRRDCGFELGALASQARVGAVAAGRHEGTENAMDPGSVLERRRELTFQDLGDELLIRDGSGAKVHVLNRTGRELYLALDGETSLENVAASLGERYRRDVLADVLELAARLVDLGLVEESGPSS